MEKMEKEEFGDLKKEDVSQDKSHAFHWRRLINTDKMFGYQFSEDGENWIWGERFEKTPKGPRDVPSQDLEDLRNS